MFVNYHSSSQKIIQDRDSIYNSNYFGCLISMIVREATLISILLFLITMFFTNTETFVAKASELRSTNKNHFTKGPTRGRGGSFAKSRKHRTKVVEKTQGGVIARSSESLTKAAEFDSQASIACRQGRLRRFSGGIADLGGIRYPAGSSKDMSRKLGIKLTSDIYIFVNECSSACRVYRYTQ